MGALKGLKQSSAALLLAKGCINVPGSRPLTALSPTVTPLLRLSPVVTDIPGLAPPAGSTPTLWMLPLAETAVYLPPQLLKRGKAFIG